MIEWLRWRNRAPSLQRLSRTSVFRAFPGDMANPKNLGAFFVLLWTCRMAWSKGIILYGKGKVVAAKKTTPTSMGDDKEEGTDRFQFALFTPTARIGTPSDSFNRFTRQAISARLTGHGQQRLYYFMQETKNYETGWMTADSNVCQNEAKAWQLRPTGGFLFADSEQTVTVYFLCDHHCCGTQCCDLNVIFLVCMIFLILLGLSVIIWGFCRYGHRHWRRTKDMHEEEFFDAEEYIPVPPIDLQKLSTSSDAQKKGSASVKFYTGADDDVRL